MKEEKIINKMYREIEDNINSKILDLEEIVNDIRELSEEIYKLNKKIKELKKKYDNYNEIIKNIIKELEEIYNKDSALFFIIKRRILSKLLDLYMSIDKINTNDDGIEII